MPTPPSLRICTVAGVIALFAISSVSCQEPGYRNEVYSNGQGNIVVRREPKDTATLEREAAVANAEAAATSQPVDPDLAVVEAQWPHLSSADRKTVVELVQRLVSR